MAKRNSRLFARDSKGVVGPIKKTTKKKPTKKPKQAAKKKTPVELGYVTAALVLVDCAYGWGNFTSWSLSELKGLAHRQNLRAEWQGIEETQKQELADYLTEIRSEWQLFIDACRESPVYKSLQTGDADELSRCISCTVSVGLYGTGVLVDVSPHDQVPWILTCAHNIDHDDDVEDEEPSRIGRLVTIVTMDNIVCAAVCRYIESELDLAVLEPKFDAGTKAKLIQEKRFPNLRAPDQFCKEVLCVGNSNWDGDKSSNGRFKLAKGELLKPENRNSKSYIEGLPLMRHSCPTNWGFSGGPIFSVETDAALHGMHTSWNPNTRARHAVGLLEIWQVVKWVARGLH